MKNRLFVKIKKNNWQTLALVILIMGGIFLRTYHFQQLLVFASDQSRDLELVRNVVENHAAWPLLGPDMTGGQGFRLGAIYYYFQIISAKIFGVGASQQAYPDLFFSILSIPLMYYFLRRYFSENTAIFSITVYVFSYFVIEYSRFAWNVNLIPFFALLFLYACGEFLLKEDRVGWKWIVALGIAIGVGIQLHAILLLLLPSVTLLVFVFLLLRNKKVWRSFVIVLLLAICLNVGQLMSEQETGFANTKTFFNAFFFKSDRTGGSVMKDLKLDVVCNSQASSHALSSLGGNNICDFLYGQEVVSTTYNTRIELNQNPIELLGKLASLLFFLVGCGFLLQRLFWEGDEKKRLWGLLILYGALYFLIMIPIAPGSRLRYYLPVEFMPFVFLALVFDFLRRKYPKHNILIISGVLVTLLALNINTIYLRLGVEGCGKKIQNSPVCDLIVK